MEEHGTGKQPDGRVDSSRPEWDDYFLDIVGLVAKRATCLPVSYTHLTLPTILLV